MLFRSNGEPVAFDPDPMKQMSHSIQIAYVAAPIYALGDFHRISGAGVYGIYYFGEPLPYAPDYDYCARPVYVGSAVPKGWSLGQVVNVQRSLALRCRVNNHRCSIDQVMNLDVNDFWVRVCVLDAAYIKFAEDDLTHLYQPLWNITLKGFGNKALGKERATSKVTAWDRQHPGRKRG